MAFSIRESGQFAVEELIIQSKVGPIDISSIYEEINIFDSLFLPVITGNILIVDAKNVSSELLFDGSESLLMTISKSEGSEIAQFKKAFRIYKQTNRSNISQNAEAYVLHFVSDELIFSDQQKVNQSYETTYGDAIVKIMRDYLQVTGNNLGGIYEKTSGIRKFVVPNLSPFDAIDWCTKRSVDNLNSPNYMFFQNITGYNFVSLSTLLQQEHVLSINLNPKNQKGDDAIDEMLSARSYEVLQQYDLIQKTRNGVISGKFVGFDPMTRTIATRNLGYSSHYSNMKHGNLNPNFTDLLDKSGKSSQYAHDSRKSLSIFGSSRKYSEYVKSKDPTSISKIQDHENIINQRRALLNNLMSKRLKMVMPGNFQLSSGFNIDLEAPSLGEKVKGEDNEDISLSGKYIITASRQMIKYGRHETIIEVASSSNNNKFIPKASVAQNEAIKNY